MDLADSTRKEFAARIRPLLEIGLISTAEFAQVLHVSESEATAWLAGQRMPRGDELLRMAPYFGRSVLWLLTGQDEEVRTPEQPPVLFQACGHNFRVSITTTGHLEVEGAAGGSGVEQQLAIVAQSSKAVSLVTEETAPS